MKTVIKIGGSLQSSSSIVEVCDAISELSTIYDLVVVPGGGKFADLVRDFQNDYSLSDETAHLMALRAMELYGLTLNELISELSLAKSLATASDGSTVFLPLKEVKDSELESSWRVTSDSISAWVCGELGCEKLVLIKRVDGIRRSKKLLSSIKVGELEEMEQSVVDPKLSEILKNYGISCWIVNGEYPERIGELLETDRTKGTKILLGGEY